MEYIILAFAYIMIALFWVSPIALFIWFIYSLIRLIRCNKEDKGEFYRSKRRLIISGILTAVDIAFTILVITGMSELEYM